MNAGITDNAFANSVSYDSIGRTISQTINVDGNNHVNAYFGGGLPFFSKLLNLNPSINGSLNNYSGFVNGEKNKTSMYNTNVALDLEIQLDTIFFNIGYSVGYNHSVSSLSTASAKPYTDQSFSAGIGWRFPFKFSLDTKAEYTMNSQRAEGYNTNVLIWDASLSKAFLKTENFIVTISGNDILNQNISNKRTIQDNIITDTKTGVISRYFLLKLTYKFNNTHTKDEEQGMF